MRYFFCMAIAICMIFPAVAALPVLSNPNGIPASSQKGTVVKQEKKAGLWSAFKIYRQQKKQFSNMGIFPERMELTEGFQWLPFFGTLLTGGLVWLIMLFTAKDANAMRWAGIAFSIIAIAATVASIVAAASA